MLVRSGVVMFAMLSACIPSPSSYGPHTCRLSHAEWSGDVMLDPNDSSRIAWPICIVRDVRFAAAPQNPRGE